MPKYSTTSREKLETCDMRLQKVFNEVIKHFDCTILSGHRGQVDQDLAFMKGRSKIKYPSSKHNKQPSLAVDAIPYPIDWKDRERMSYFAGFVKGVALYLGITIRWGGDWDSDTEVKDNTFDDLCHFELEEVL